MEAPLGYYRGYMQRGKGVGENKINWRMAKGKHFEGKRKNVKV
jgi:hypothetical protein